jgi:hypothetical protein
VRIDQSKIKREILDPTRQPTKPLLVLDSSSRVDYRSAATRVTAPTLSTSAPTRRIAGIPDNDRGT